MSNSEPVRIPADDEHDARLVWISPDDRGIELEMIAAVLPDYLFVFHVQPTSYEHQGE